MQANSDLVIGDVENEYQKWKQLKKEDVTALIDWVNGREHLPKITEMQAIHFLHSKNFNMEDAKGCLDNFYTFRTNLPLFFADRNPQNLDMDLVTYLQLPKKTPEGYRVILGTVLDRNPERYNLATQIKLFDMTMMLTLNKLGTCEGQHVVHDLTGLSLSHIARLNVTQLKKFFCYLKGAMPVRLKGLHFINTGNLIDKLLFVIKPFMAKELVDILYTHPKIETLHQHVPQECLPSDFGGSAPSISTLHSEAKKELIDHIRFFEEEEKQVVNESKRTGKREDLGDGLEVEGSLKNLNID